MQNKTPQTPQKTGSETGSSVRLVDGYVYYSAINIERHTDNFIQTENFRPHNRKSL